VVSQLLPAPLVVPSTITQRASRVFAVEWVIVAMGATIPAAHKVLSPSGSLLCCGEARVTTPFVAALKKMFPAFPFYAGASPVQTGPSRNGANHVATD
jgi:hypothetical protein